MATVAGAASPPAPLVVAAAPTVVPSAVGQHELHVRPQRGDHLIENWLVVCECRMERQGGQRLLDVVAQVHGTALLGRDRRQRMTFTKQPTAGSEVCEAGMGHLPGAVEIVRMFEHL